MDHSFWHRRWENNDIPFHERDANPLLVKYLDRLSLRQGSRLFLPLCGKTLDIAWLLSKGHRVAGAELSEMAIRQLFTELGITPTITKTGSLDHFSAPDIDIFVGDLFDVSGEMLGKVDAIYDRAALVALPDTIRADYTAHLMKITQKAPQLLICYEYDQSQQPGPPFSVDSKEVHQHYQTQYAISLLASPEVRGGLKGRCAATEHVWLLK